MSNARARLFFDMVVEMRKRQRVMEKLYGWNPLLMHNEYQEWVDNEIERVEKILSKH